MGFWSSVGGKVRDALATDKEKAAQAFSKGATSSSYPSSGVEILQAYGYDVLSDYLRLEQDLMSRYVDYEEMDDYPLIATGLDIYADDASQPESQLKTTIWVTSPDENVEQILNDLFNKTLRLDEEIWEIARTLTKYGNDYEELLVTDQGVVALNFLPVPTVRRVEGPRGELYGFVQDFKGKFGYSPQEFQQILAARSKAIKRSENAGSYGSDKVAAMEDWEVVHFRLRGKHRRSVYGFSALEPARWIWKRLMLLEDAALLYRLQRAPERFAFYVDVGDLPPAEALAFVNRVRQQHKKRKYFNPSTNKLDLKWEPLSQDDDFFVPVRKGVDSTRIDVLGAPAWQHMEDIEYFQDKLFAGMKIPKAYLAQDESVSRAILSSEDVRFARTVLRVQRELRNGMSKIARVHLAALGIDPAKVEYDVHMTTPSAIFELAQLEVKNARADLAARMGEFVSNYWLLSNVFHMSDDEIEEVMIQKDEDAIREASRTAQGEKQAADITGVPVDGEEPEGEYDSETESKPIYASNSQLIPLSKYAKRIREEKRKRNAKSRRHRMTEEELFRGDKQAEKRAAEKLDKMLRNDEMLANRLKEVGGMVRELSVGGKAKR